MKHLMEWVHAVAADPVFAFVPDDRRAAARAAFEAGLRCIVRCQVRVNGQPSVWCAQHDAATLEPRGARTYELASLSGAESAGLLELLMRVEAPSPEVVRAVHAGVRWFERSRLAGIRQVRVNGDKRIVPDPAAPPLWARFYDLETNRPIFVGRDGVKKPSLAEIEAERRNGYAWYGDWGAAVARQYAAWQNRLPSAGEGFP
jgi:PelA/Pel-15E family pectate lyase